MNVLKIARVPAPRVAAEATVREAVGTMDAAGCGAVVVVKDDRLVGILSERDVMLRAVGAGLDPARTPVSHIMSRDVHCLQVCAGVAQAIRLMTDHGVRHLPIVDDLGRVAGLVSIRDASRAELESLADQVRSLQSYLGADVPGA